MVGIEGARQLQFPLTGAFSSAGPFTFGPWYYYQMIIASLIFPNSYSPWIFLGITSVISVIILYKIGEILLDKNFGLILSLLGAISPALIISSTHLTNPNLTNVFALLSVWIFLKIAVKKVSYWWGFILGICLGISINIHYQMVGLLILPIILLIYKYKQYKYFLTIVSGIIVTFIPLLLFDLTNHWHNTKNIFYYYTEGKNKIYVPNRWLFYIRDFWPAYWGDVIGVNQIIASLIAVIGVISVIFLLIKKKLPIPFLFLLLAFVFNFLLLRFYWGERFFGYLNYLRPFVFIFTGIVLYIPFSQWLSNKKILRLALILFFLTIYYLSSSKSLELIKPDEFTIEMHEMVNNLKSKYPNKKFTIYQCNPEGNSFYSKVSHSLIFLLDKEKKLNDNEIKLAIAGKNCTLFYDTTTGILKTNGQYPQINDYIFDISNLPVAEAKNVKLEKDSFNNIYNATTRWWFKEQP